MRSIKDDIVWAVKLLQQSYLSSECNYIRCERILRALKKDKKNYLLEYGRHKDDCSPKPWENECKCGFLQALKGKQDD